MPWFIDSQTGSLSLDGFLVFIYLVVALLISSTDTAKCLLASVSCQIYGLSPLYNHIDNNYPDATFLIYSFVYFLAIYSLKSYKVMIACFIMAIFQIIMHKAMLNEIGSYTASLWLYNNYEILVTLLHGYIVFSVVRGNKLRSSVWNCIDNILRRSHSLGSGLYYGS